MHVLGDHLSHYYLLLSLSRLILLRGDLTSLFDLVDLLVLSLGLRVRLVDHGLNGFLLSSPGLRISGIVALTMAIHIDTEQNGEDGQRHESVFDEWSQQNSHDSL